MEQVFCGLILKHKISNVNNYFAVLSKIIKFSILGVITVAAHSEIFYRI